MPLLSGDTEKENYTLITLSLFIMNFTCKKSHSLFSTYLLFFLLFASAAVKAQGNLLITPRRVVFEGNKKSQEINLANIGKDSANYVISFIQIKMNDDGSFERITEAENGQNFADKNLRFFPRSVSLAPNEAQTIKIQLIKTNELQAGEYRSHLYMRANPPQKPLGEETKSDNDSMLSVRLVPVFGISIPVIIRKGVSDATVKITDVAIKAEKDSLYSVDITFGRAGNMSVYGDVYVEHISPEGVTTKVGSIKGMAVYTPNTTRRFHLLLEKNTAVNFKKGNLKVTYYDQSFKPQLLAESTVAIK